jgi:hypothetical protein
MNEDYYLNYLVFYDEATFHVGEQTYTDVKTTVACRFPELPLSNGK